MSELTKNYLIKRIETESSEAECPSCQERSEKKFVGEFYCDEYPASRDGMVHYRAFGLVKCGNCGVKKEWRTDTVCRPKVLALLSERAAV